MNPMIHDQATVLTDVTSGMAEDLFLDRMRQLGDVAFVLDALVREVREGGLSPEMAHAVLEYTLWGDPPLFLFGRTRATIKELEGQNPHLARKAIAGIGEDHLSLLPEPDPLRALIERDEQRLEVLRSLQDPEQREVLRLRRLHDAEIADHIEVVEGLRVAALQQEVPDAGHEQEREHIIERIEVMAQLAQRSARIDLSALEHHALRELINARRQQMRVSVPDRQPRRAMRR